VFIPVCAFAEIYKCVEKGATVFSDAPCGADQTVIHIDTDVRNGYQLSNPRMEQMADEMQSDRIRKDLDRQIEKLHQKIEQIESEYLSKSASLEAEISDHKAAKHEFKWSGNEGRRKNYRKRLNELSDALSATKRKYKSDRRLAYIDLAQLKEKRRQQ
jgi:hypothetical protein